MTYVFVDDKSKLPKRAVDNYYPTDPKFIKQFYKKYFNELIKGAIYILDPGCGDGGWGRELKQLMTNPYVLAGIDINQDLLYQCGHYYTFTHKTEYQNFTPMPMESHLNGKVDLIIGNPPFDQHIEFIEKSFDLIDDDGYIALLFPTLYIAGNKRYNSVYKDCGFYKMVIPTKRVRFIGHGNSPMKDMAMFIWKKGYGGNPTVEWLEIE